MYRWTQGPLLSTQGLTVAFDKTDLSRPTVINGPQNGLPHWVTSQELT